MLVVSEVFRYSIPLIFSRLLQLSNQERVLLGCTFLNDSSNTTVVKVEYTADIFHAGAPVDGDAVTSPPFHTAVTASPL